jgi:hypothetical protein
VPGAVALTDALTVALTVALALTAAPAAAQSGGWQLAASLGAGFRAERGHTIGGARLEAGLRRPVGAANRRLELSLGLAQVTAHHGVTGDSGNVKENSVEAAALGELRVAGPAAGGRYNLTLAAGPVMAVSVGCTAGGSFAGDKLGYGGSACTNAFARAGSVRLGGMVRVANEVRFTNAALTVGAATFVNTIASGNTAGYAVFVGLRAGQR